MNDKMISNTVRLFIAMALCCQAYVYGQQTAHRSSGSAKVDLSPTNWPEDELKKYDELNAKFGGQNQLATSKTGIISGTTSASAIRAGLEALNQGGTAADAALTTSLTQISLAQGAWVSYAGIITMVYYDAESDQVYCMNGGYNTVLGEDNPATIPAAKSGRTALVPGYMAGVESAHQRFGRLPFKQIFAPAIYYAENGFTLHALHEAFVNGRRETLSRFPETKKLFTDEQTGEFYKAGDLLKQPELATTLKAVSEHGSDYMYNGPWAKKLVAAVQADGGKMTAEDLRRYRVLWTNPLRLKYGQHEIFCPGLPAQGGVHLAETLNLMSLAKLSEKGHYSKSPESFFWLSQFTTVMALSFVPPATQKMLFGRETPLEDRRTNEFATELWAKMKEGDFSLTQKPQGMGDNHSDAIVAIDRWGNIAAIVHTINTSAWGQTGIFVDGVSIPDSASFQQLQIAQLKPGSRLPDPTLPLIVSRDGKPVAALSSIGAGLHSKTVTSLTNLLDFGQDVKTAIDAPSMHLPKFGTDGPPTQQVFAGEFSEKLIEGVKKLGLKIEVVPNNLKSRAPRGYVVGATIDPQSGQRQAVSTKMFNASALGQK